MAVSISEAKIIAEAIKKRQTIKFEYFPNTAPVGTALGFRYVTPIKSFKKSGKFYLLCWFQFGVSLSGKGSGYRLYLQKNIHNVSLVTSGTQNFSKTFNYNIILQKLLIKNQFD
jgi:hypothetical protein